MRVSYITMNRMMEDQLAQDPGLRKSLERRGRGVLSDGRAMSDSQLLPHLHSSNVELDRPQFEQLAGRYLSAEEMSRALLKKSSRELGGNPSRRGRNRWRQIAASARRATALAPDFPLEFPDVFSREFDSCRRSCRENVALCERREQNTNSPIWGDCRNVFQFNDLGSRGDWI